MCEDTTGWFYASFVLCFMLQMLYSIFILVFDFAPDSYLKMLKFLDQLVLRHMKLGIPRE